ncbi:MULTISPECIES: HAD family hydrolase [unclassified Minwuia]|jgi:HAD superfamily hydrolase (TIGR01509 family)|uniref:HAD family hydrolase n=1 Tax=unclassified Minwuia TaxID=2618799 RepID=UPI00247930A3|nr:MULTISPECIES: HAD family hydrolase [unclassified Minwuia]
MSHLVIFDCDGVLVDSERPANRLLTRYLNDHGVAIEVEETEATFVGLSLSSCAELVLERFGVRLPDSFVSDIRTGTAEVLAREVKAIPGVRGAVERITALTCVASSGEVSKMTLTLGTTGIIDLFAGRLFSATMVKRGKPAPDLFLHAAREMNVDPRACVVVEDSPFGLQAARAAGMRALGFTGGSHRDHDRDRQMLLDAGAEGVFQHMDDLPELVVRV